MAEINSEMIQLGLQLLQACQQGTWQSVSDILRKGITLSCSDGDHNTWLHYATAGNNVGVIKKMHEEHETAYLACLLTRAEPEGYTPLMLACTLGHAELVDLFLSQSSEVWTVTSKNGQTPLHLASFHNRAEVVDLLLKRKVGSIDAQDQRQATPLHLAIGEGHVKVALTLIDHGADLSRKNLIGANALFLAVRREQWEIVKRIVKEPGVDVNTGTRMGVTPLHITCSKETPEAAEALLALGADPNCADSSNVTPLHAASNRGSLDIVRALVNVGADITAVTKQGYTSLCLAARMGNMEVVEYFLKQGAKVHVDAALDPISEANLQGHTKVAHRLMRHLFKRYLKL